MLVDTGAAVHCIFDDGPETWRDSEGRRAATPHMGGRPESKEVALKVLDIGSHGSDDPNSARRAFYQKPWWQDRCDCHATAA
jgi:hypothetical protein